MFSNLRLRLTIYNTAVLLLFLLIFSNVIYVFMYQHVYNRVNSGLNSAAARVQSLHELPAIPVNCNYVLRDNNLEITAVSTSPLATENSGFIKDIRKYAEKAQDMRMPFHVDLSIGVSEIRVYSVPVEKQGEKGVVQVYLNIDREISYLSNLVKTLLALNIFGLIALSVISWFLVGKSLEPVKRTWQQQKDFIADVSHELRTPLSIIQTNLDVIMSDKKSSIEQNIKWLENINDEADQMSSIINDLLFIAKKDANQIELKKSYFNLSNAIKNSINEMEPLFRDAGISLEKDVTEDINFSGDELRIKQMMKILLDNALKYTKEKGRVVVKSYVKDRTVFIEVADNGIGLSADDKELIFNRFYRGDRARLKKGGGFGLGLNIANWIVKEHEGSISVMAEEGKGSSFIVSFPTMQSTLS